MRLPGMLPPRDLSADDWYTPRYIFDALCLTFDVDVCAPTGGVPWIPARTWIDEEQDGLTAQWDGLVWCNPPYSNPSPWLRRMCWHPNGVALIPLDPTLAAWESIYDTAALLCALRDRVTFVQPDNQNVTSARFPSVLIAWGSVAADAVGRCGLGWVWQRVRAG